MTTSSVALPLPLYAPRLDPPLCPSGLTTPGTTAGSSYLGPSESDTLSLHRLHTALGDPPPGAAALRAPAREMARPSVLGAKRPLVLAAAAAGGKLVMAIGASAAVKASQTDGIGDTAVSCALLVGGFGAALAAAICFGQDVHKTAQDQEAWLLKAVSISAALTLAASSALHQLVQDNGGGDLGWLPFGVRLLGYVLLSISLPSFFRRSEEAHGPAVVRHRQAITRGLGGAGFAMGFSWAANVGASQTLPPYVGQVVLTVAATSTVLSFALAASSDASACRAAARTGSV